MPIKGSKDSDDSLDFKKTSAINGPFGWRPGPGKIGQKKTQNTLLVTSVAENPKHNFFSIERRRLPESAGGSNSSLALAAGQYWPKSSSHCDGRRGHWYESIGGLRFRPFWLR